MTKNFLYLTGRFLKTLYDRFFEDGCTYRSAALTYTTLLSLVPLITVSFAIFSAFPVFSHISGQIQDFIFSHFVATSGEQIQQYLTKFVAQTKNLSAIGSCFLVLTAVLMMFTMEKAFNAIWRVKSRRLSISTFLLYWAILTLSPILIGLSIIVSSYIIALPFITSTAQHLGIITALPFLLNLVFFTLIYVLVPNCHVPIRYGFIGSVVATILFTFAKFGFTYYVTHFPTYILLYGALAAIPLFLLWLYVMWMIILFGAIISNVLTTGYRFRSLNKMDGFSHLYHWLCYFWQALQEGKQLSLGELLRLDSCNYEVDPVHLLEMMQQAKLIQPASSGRFVLSQDLSTFTLQDLLYKMPWRLPSKQEISQWQQPWQKNLQAIIEQSDTNTGEILKVPLADLFR